MKTQGLVFIKTPAKITTVLRVLKKRPDNYHEVRLVLVPISLYDTLRITKSVDKGVSFSITTASNLDENTDETEADGELSKNIEDNLVVRAARKFCQAANITPALDMALEKHIPVGAGLGGGSGNAAGTLISLNRMYARPLSPAQLHQLALELGADVPFFLHPRPTLARGVGDRLAHLHDYPTLTLLVVKPRFSISTAEAYAQVTPRDVPEATPEMAGLAGSTSLNVKAPEALEAEIARELINDFEAALFPRYPQLAELKNRLLELGADGAALSGSGSALFGVFLGGHALQRRDEAGKALLQDTSLGVFPCHSLGEHDYHPAPAL